MGPGTTLSTATAAVEAVLSSILTLTRRGRLQISRFGAFERKQRPARRIYSISQGRMVDTPATAKLTFTPAKGFPERDIL